MVEDSSMKIYLGCKYLNKHFWGVFNIPRTQQYLKAPYFRCDFIQMGYYIHTVARTAGVYDDIVVKLPIVIDPKVISIHW